ncbi:hypothetical protein HMSSN036_49010 [Paenibacillus macerans]|nr:hypothetical protein HMSSN036_49010 [Paenibacillus macerans]
MKLITIMKSKKDFFLLKNMNGELSDIDSLRYFAEKGYDSFKEFFVVPINRAQII